MIYGFDLKGCGCGVRGDVAIRDEMLMSSVRTL